MTRVGETITELIEARIGQINTLDLGTVIAVNSDKMLVDVKLKHSVDDTEVILREVPIMYPQLGDSAVIILPTIGAVVLVGYTRYERGRQLKQAGVVKVNPLVQRQLTHALVLGGIGLVPSTLPTPLAAAGEILIKHKSGSYIWFKDNGAIEIKSDVEVNVVVPE